MARRNPQQVTAPVPDTTGPAAPMPDATVPGATAPDRAAAVRRSWLPAVVCGCYLAAAVIVTWRLWAHLGSATLTGNPGDQSLFAWFLRNEATAISHGRLPALVTTAMNVPHGISMMWNTTVLLPGVLLTPVTLLAGPQASLTVLLTVGFAGSAASMFYVLRRYGVSLAAAAIGGAVYGFSPAVAHAAIGHFQLQFVVLLPLIVDAVLRLCLGRSRPVRGGLWLGVLVVAQIFTGEEMLFEAALAAAAIIVVLALSRPKAAAALARPAALGLAIAAGVTLLLAGWALWSQFLGPLRMTGSAFWPDYFKNDVGGFVVPSASQLLHTGAAAAAAARYPGGQPEYVAYLGIPLIVVLLVAAIAFWRQLPVRACAITAAVLLVLSIGAHPLVSVTAQPSYFARIQLGPWPWSWVANLPVVGDLLPSRLSMVADGTVAAVLAFGIDLGFTRLRRTRLGQARAAAVVAVVALVAVLPLVPRPLAATPAVPQPAGWAAAIGALRLPAGGRLLVVPVPTAVLDYGLRWQAEGGQQVSLIGGYFEGPDSTGRAYVDGPGFPPLVGYLDYLWLGQAWTGTPPPAPTATEVRATLAYWRPQAVAADAAARPALERYLTGIFGQPTIRYGSMLGWRL